MLVTVVTKAYGGCGILVSSVLVGGSAELKSLRTTVQRF
jgi:hypothetical protein